MYHRIAEQESIFVVRQLSDLDHCDSRIIRDELLVQRVDFVSRIILSFVGIIRDLQFGSAEKPFKKAVYPRRRSATVV